MAGQLQRAVVIRNALGLHARASARFCAVAGSFDAKIRVASDEAVVSGTSIMGLMMLGAPMGSQITIVAEGPQAEQALDALARLVEHLFGEPA